MTVDTDRANELFVRHRAYVNRLVYRLVGPDPDHDDIVQDVFLRIISKADGLRDPLREAAWVARITVSVVRNQLRRRRVRRIVELWPRVPEQEVRLEPELLDRDLARRSYQLLDALNPDDRITLLLRRVEERSIDEVAAACSCSRATVKRRLARAERELNLLLEKRPDLFAEMRSAAENGGGQ